MSSNSGLRLPGSLTVSKLALSAVGSSLDVDVQWAAVNVDRTKADGTATFVNFIMADYDLNGKVDFTASSTTDRLDDAYGLTGFTLASADASNPSFSLPSASNIDVDAGNIDAVSPVNGTLGSFPVTLTLSVSDQGVMSASIAISGQDVSADAVEDAAKAQQVYWSGVQSAPTVGADDPDILAPKLTASELSTYYASALTSITNQYNNKQMVESWSIAITAVTKDVNSTIAKHAREHNKAGTKNIFSVGDKLVAFTPFSYSVKVEDYLGVEKTIVAAADVYGVLKQS